MRPLLSSSPAGGDVAVRRALEAGDLPSATEAALRAHGRDVLRFLRARCRNPADAEDAFSQFGEDLHRGLPTFHWRASLRTWMFVLARNAANRHANRAHRHWEGPELGSMEACSAALQWVRETTPHYMQTTVKQRIRELRRSLPEEQQTLLSLRVDRGLSWKALAVVMGEAQGIEDPALDRAAARMRTRFQAVKKALRVLAERDGLLS